MAFCKALNSSIIRVLIGIVLYSELKVMSEWRRRLEQGGTQMAERTPWPNVDTSMASYRFQTNGRATAN